MPCFSVFSTLEKYSDFIYVVYDDITWQTGGPHNYYLILSNILHIYGEYYTISTYHMIVNPNKLGQGQETTLHILKA